MRLYRTLFRLVLVRLDAERAHVLGLWALRILGRVPGLARRLGGRPDPVLRVAAFGLEFPSPLGVAAGLDKDALCFESLGELGFGFVEVGTVTAEAQPGNPRPRVWRAPARRALLNAMGFPNHGAVAAAARLARRRGDRMVAVNVGKSRSADVEDAVADYRRAVRAVAPQADFLVVNVSSPNTPGLRTLQSSGRLAELVAGIRAELADAGRAELPLLVKIAPDLSDEELDEIADFAVAERLAGIVATNTTVDRGVLGADAAGLPERGGVSGAPLAPRALAVLRHLHARAGGALPLVSVGGIESADDVWERLAAGATLVQAYTGFVYGGPLWARQVNRDLAARVRAAGLRSVADLRAGSPLAQS